MDYIKGPLKGLMSSLGAGDMDLRQLLTQGVNLGDHQRWTQLNHSNSDNS